jgi:agmatinase
MRRRYGKGTMLSLLLAPIVLGFVTQSVWGQTAKEKPAAAKPAPETAKPAGERIGLTAEELRPVEIPADVKDKISAADQAYVTTGHATRFVRSEQFFDRIRKGTLEQATAYIAALRSAEDAVDFKQGRDPLTVPLDTSSPEFNAWKMLRPRNADPKREAGPINLSPYMSGFGGGIPTFAGAPVALTVEDIIAGKAEVAIVGAPLDMGSGFRDALHGPNAVRTNMGAQGPTGLDIYTMVNPGAELRMVDFGDIAVDNLSTDRSVEHVRDVIRDIAKTGAIPIIIGGDHSLSYPNLAALADVHGKGKIGVVHFDSHFDAWHDYNPHLIDHGQPVYRLISEGHVLGKHYIQVGLRSRGHTEDEFAFMRENQMRYHTMAEVERRGWEAVMERAVAEAKEGTEKLFISFDIDSLDPAYMPGTGTPVPGGLTMREAEPIVRRLCAENNIVGMDLVEVAPYLDSSYKTAHNSNFILNACLTGIAMRKKGLVQPHYLSPISSEHGQSDYYKGK